MRALLHSSIQSTVHKSLNKTRTGSDAEGHVHNFLKIGISIREVHSCSNILYNLSFLVELLKSYYDDFSPLLLYRCRTYLRSASRSTDLRDFVDCCSLDTDSKPDLLSLSKSCHFVPPFIEFS